MTLESDFLSMLPASVIVKTRTGRGTDGAPSFSTSATTYRCRLVNSNAEVRDASGNVKVAKHEMWMYSTGSFSPESRYQLPDGSTPPVLSVDQFPDMEGAHHTRIRLGF